MTTTGSAIFFDGVTSARHAVTVDLGATALVIRSADGRAIAQWRYDEIEPLSAPKGLLRIGRTGSATLARLEVFDQKLAGALIVEADLAMPIRITVLRKSEANAITLPGGIVYVFQGLIDKSETPDELAGVIAHEFGHVAHRDGTRHVLAHAGMAFLFG